MRRAHLTLVVCLLSALPALAQQRQRIFDNFDTTRSVQVIQQDRPLLSSSARAYLKPTTATKLTANTVDKKFVAKTGKVTARNTRSARTVQMNAGEGMAATEMSTFGTNRNTGGYSAVSSAGLKGFTTGDPLVDSYIVDSSRRYGIDPLLIYSQMHQESSFKPRAVSPKGASGLMQLMPATARRMGVSNIYDPKENIEGGVKYMRLLLDMFGGSVNLALAGYNAGEGAVMKYGNQIPPYSETQEYVRRIGARYAAISDGTYAHNYRRVNITQAARLEQKESRPLTVYEPSPVAIRLADGRMRLVNQ